eukprot:TRINITY_DN3531_c0_g3_i1.p1 TRINITY_DN3531_c0_g3~~TRINITY_DN3531_c0_g3_i1.p1  ORF type:complete len:138 (+),score=20.51 TRINITY_DN3531_c0_g3_i1:30-416(+)
MEHHLSTSDRFVIFASDGLWEHLSNQEAVDFVSKHPPKDAARKVVKEALARASQRRNMSIQEIHSLGPGRRRVIHDDITVIILFFDQDIVASEHREAVTVSVKDTDLGLDEWSTQPRDTQQQQNSTEK